MVGEAHRAHQKNESIPAGRRRKVSNCWLGSRQHIANLTGKVVKAGKGDDEPRSKVGLGSGKGRAFKTSSLFIIKKLH